MDFKNSEHFTPFFYNVGLLFCLFLLYIVAKRMREEEKEFSTIAVISRKLWELKSTVLEFAIFGGPWNRRLLAKPIFLL